MLSIVFEQVVTNFLGNLTTNKFIVANMMKNEKTLGCLISLKVH